MRPLVPKGEETERPICASPTQGRQSLNRIRKRKAVQQLSKGLTGRVSIEPHKNEGFAMVFNDTPRKGHKSREKMGFVDKNHIELPEGLIPNFIEGPNPSTRDPPSVMRHDGRLLSVACVRRMGENEHSHPQTCVARRETQKASGLPRKHGPHDQCEGHLRRTCRISVNGHDGYRIGGDDSSCTCALCGVCARACLADVQGAPHEGVSLRH
jgi:hypothetical protein